MPHRKEEIKAALDAWIQAVGIARGDASKILRLYDPNAVLLATFSSRVRLNAEGDAKGYFEYFTGLPEIEGQLDEAHIQLDEQRGGFAAAGGLYSFFHNSGSNGERIRSQARFTFTYRFDPELKQWRIIQHHSSVLPEERADPPKG